MGQLAAGAGHSALADGMTLRQAQALHWLGRDAEARRLLATLAERAGSGSQEARGAAIATLARMSFAKGNDSIGIAALRRLGAAGPASHPMLVWEATLPRPAVRDVPEGELWSRDRGPRGADVTGLRWVDIGYVIKPDGSVADVHTRRGSDRLITTLAHTAPNVAGK